MMIQTENIKDMIREMEKVAAETKSMREADKLHNILVYGYKAIAKKHRKEMISNGFIR